MSDQPVNMDIAQLDTPIHRATIDQLPVEALDICLAEIRERRLAVVNKLQSVREAKRRAYLTDLAEKYTKQHTKTKRAIERVDEMLGKAEEYLNKLRAMELELRDEPGTLEDDDEPEVEETVDGDTY